MPYTDPSKRIYDFSGLSQWMLCQRRWYWYGVRNLVPEVSAPALHFGKAIHGSRQEWYTTWDQAKMMDRLAKEMVGMPADQLRTEAKAEIIMKGYVRKWPHPEPFKVLQNEYEFELPMPDGSTLTGRMDAIIEWDGKILVDELKTTSGGIGSWYLNQFTPNLQVDIYCYAVMKLMGRCDGVLVDAVQVCKTKEGYARDVQDRTAEDLTRFESRYLDIVRDIEAKGKDYPTGTEPTSREIYTQNQLMCTYYGECPYRPLCIYNNDGLIEGRYTERKIMETGMKGELAFNE